MNAADLAILEQITAAVISSEEDVRLKVVAQIFRLLGYADDWLATEFPVYGFQGRKALPPTFADVVYFNDPDWSKHKTEPERVWAQDHALVVVEVKKPTEHPDPSGQVEYYAQWLRVPHLVSTNGSELIVRRFDGFCRFKDVLRVRVKELVAQWQELEDSLQFNQVTKFVNDLQLKARKAADLDYEHYLLSLHAELTEQLRWPISRFLEKDDQLYLFNMSLRSLLEAREIRERLSAEDILTTAEPAVILGEPGSGKTYLLSQLAINVIEQNYPKEILLIPVLLQAKWWGKNFDTISDAIYNELKPLVAALTPSRVVSELEARRFVILIDGYDEIRSAKDLFQREIELLVRNYHAKVVLTSREANYHGELSFSFKPWSIEALSDAQIDQFAEKTTLAHHFSYQLRERNLLDLARLPLYLVMLCQIVGINEGLLPNNKAIIQERFAHFLFDEYPRKRIPAFSPVFSVETKMKFLSELAERKTDDISFDDFSSLAQEIKPNADLVALTSEIVESGLLTGDVVSGLDFIHPTVAEFFHARKVASLPIDRIVLFVQQKHPQETFVETILFLVGLLRDKGKQDPVLDYLQAHDLGLYLKCLSARYHTDLSRATDYPDIERRYLKQVQGTYNALVDSYFAPIRVLFSPFRFLEPSQRALAGECRVKVAGSVDIVNSRLAYEYIPVPREADSEPEIQARAPGSLGVTVQHQGAPPIPVMGFSDGRRFYKDLNLSRLGLDSAREVATEDLKSQLKQLIRNRTIILPIPIMCEHVVKLIHQAASMARAWRDKELESIWKFEYGVYDANEYLDVFLKIKNRSFVTVNATQPPNAIPLNLDQIIQELRYIVAHSASIPDNTLPSFDKGGQSMSYRPAARYIWDRFTPDQLAERLRMLYTILPGLYRQIVIQNFPNMGAYLWHYYTFPFKYFVRFKLAHHGGDDGGMALYWLPVSNEEETVADVKYVTSSLLLTQEELDQIHEQYVARLKAFGRFSGQYIFQPTVSKSLSSIAGKTPISDALFDLLESDMNNLLD